MKTIFVNIVGKDIVTARKFYTAIGYTVNEDYSGENTLCVKVCENVYFMILKPEYMETFVESKRNIVDPKTNLTSMYALSFESKQEVLDVTKLALENGGVQFKEPYEEYGMFTSRIEDPNGNILELGYFPGI